MKCIERANRKVVGRFLNEHGIGVVAPEDRRISQDISDSGKRNRRGETRTGRGGRDRRAAADATRGRSDKLSKCWATMPIRAWKSKLRCESTTCLMNFPQKSKIWRPNFLPVVGATDLEGREDLRALPLVTIDGETAKDFDDAVYCERRGKGYKLWVAIADVSHYVRDGDALDQEARSRGNSVYFPRRVIPDAAGSIVQWPVFA